MPELFGDRRQGRSLHLKWMTYSSTRFLAGAAMGSDGGGVLRERRRVDSRPLCGNRRRRRLSVKGLRLAFATITSWIRGNARRRSREQHGPVMSRPSASTRRLWARSSFAYNEISPWSAFLFLAPALAAQQLFSLYQEKARLYEEQLSLYADLKVANTRLSEANLSFATALVQTLEESDRYTAGHSRAVATYSRDIAEKLGLPLDEQERTYLSGLVHDIGKIGLPASLAEQGRPSNAGGVS